VTTRSLRTELLIRLALVSGAALGLLATLFAVPAWRFNERPVALLLAVLGIVLVLLGGVGLLLERTLFVPLRGLAVAANEIGSGDLARRMPEEPARELREISASVDRLTSRVLADQAQLIRAEKLASVGRLSASVAHEIGTPLAAMLGHVHALRKQLLRRAAPVEELELLAALERESGRIERIVRGLLDYARARPPRPSPTNIGEVVQAAVELLRVRGALAAVDVALELTEPPLQVNAQRYELEQLFVNLLTNAVDAMDGRGRIVVRLERASRFSLREPAARRAVGADERVLEHPPSSRAQRWLAGNDAAEIAKIVVADSGPGVPAALAERIFDPFFTTKVAGKGTGLGLAIVARIVENFQGTIWVTNSREGGAAFHVLFPIYSAPVGNAAPRHVNRRRPTPPIGFPRTVRS
jgi:two-component system NtrC family sensor kinase